MSNRIDTTFSALKKSNEKAFIPFTVIGYPDFETSFNAIALMIDNGATALELGLPFSDPMADGPLIENASKHVVEKGFTTGDALLLITKVRKQYPNIPITLMTYFNLAYARGIERFLIDVKNAGVDGITFVDLPPEEGASIFDLAKSHGLAPVMLVSPLTPPERLTVILKQAEGYLYLVSRAGVTGLEETYDFRLKETISTLRRHSSLPVCLGFGISSASHVNRMLSAGADGVIVGSKFIEFLGTPSGTRSIGDLVNNLASEARQFATSTNDCIAAR